MVRRMKRNLSCEMFGVGTCEGCEFEQFDFDSEYYYCGKHETALGGSHGNHPMKLLFCAQVGKNDKPE